MTTLDRDFFLRSYRAMETDDLLAKISTLDLADAAAEAARIVLTERGVTGDRLELEHAKAVRAQFRLGGVTNQCDYCGGSILLGAISDGGQRFCSERCRDEIRLVESSIGIPTDLVIERAHQLRVEACPACHADGGLLDVRVSEAPVSLVLFHSEGRGETLCCRRCGDRANLTGILVAVLMGWWSLPGLFATPGAIYRNWRAFRTRDSGGFSPAFLHQARLRLARELGDAGVANSIERPP